MDLSALIRHCRTRTHNSAIGRAPSPYHAAAQVMWDPATRSFSWQAVAFDPKLPGAVFAPGTPDGSSKRKCRTPEDAPWSSGLELAKSVLNGIDANRLDVHREDIRFTIQVLEKMAS